MLKSTFFWTEDAHPRFIHSRRFQIGRCCTTPVVGAWIAALLVSVGYGFLLPSAFGQETVPVAPEKVTVEPVYRVAKVKLDEAPESTAKAVNAANDYSTSEPLTAALQQHAVKPATLTGAETVQPAVVPAALRTASAANSSSGNAVTPAKLVSATNRITPSPNRITPSPASRSLAPHPLDRAIATASNGLAEMRANVRDYSAIMVKRERIDGVLGSQQCMQMKVRCPRTVSGQQVPFSIYLKTLKPRKEAGREVVWIEGENENKLCAHETGLLGMKRFYLEPTGWVAMKNNRYPIMDAGLENLMVKLIEKAEAAKLSGHCDVNYRDNGEIMKRKCSIIELVNEERRECDEFHKAQVFIDTELNLPVRYVAYDWPPTPGADLPIIEEYTYVKVSLNPGFSEIDFSPENPAYKFPRR